MASSTNFVRAGLLSLLFASVALADNSTGVFNVKDYGAIGNGKSDSTKAFEAAWSAACAVEGSPEMVIPEGSYLVGPLTLKGPCQGVMGVQLKGALLAVTNLKAYAQNWIEFQYVNGLRISGGGKIDGQGASAWPYNQCPKKRSCKLLPVSLVLSFINNATITGITSLNPKLFHMNIFSSKNIQIDTMTITAPGDSPNTDGIHMGGGTANIAILNSTISTGDDCVSIGADTTNVTVDNVFCGPGHGISVGSLGRNKGEGNVVGLHVRNCTLNGTTNGVRIKTWQASPAATSAMDFTFEDLVMNDVYNPIIIDQKYCPYAACAESAPSKVKISEVKFLNIRGTSASSVAMNIVCSDAVPCQDVELSNINLEYVGTQPGNTTAMCVNANVKSNGNVTPGACIGSSNRIVQL